MDNSVCKLTVIQNPNRRYANTVNIVFFKAIPLTKNFQKYVDGLKRWKEYIKIFPESQLQIFIDRAIASDEAILSIMRELDARIYLFECNDFLMKDGFHVGLFGTVLRFFPMFDINTHAMTVAHMCDLEPDETKILAMNNLNKLSKLKEVSLVYENTNIYEKIFDTQSTMNDGIPYPWVDAGKFTAMKKVPFTLLSSYLEDIKSGKKFFNRYGTWTAQKKEHGYFSFGVDEIFLNHVYLPWLIHNNAKIVIILKDAHPGIPVYWMKKKLEKKHQTKQILNYILDKSQSVSQSFSEFDKVFYKKGTTQENIKYVRRFIEILETRPEWLGHAISKLWLRLISVNLNAAIVVHNGTIIDIVKI